MGNVRDSIQGHDGPGLDPRPIRSLVVRVASTRAATAPEQPETMTSTGGVRSARIPAGDRPADPQVALGRLAGLLRRARDRNDGQTGRAQLTDPVLEARHASFPADPLGDHGRRHARSLLQQFPELRLARVDRRAPCPAREYPGGRSVASARFTVFYPLAVTRSRAACLHGTRLQGSWTWPKPSQAATQGRGPPSGPHGLFRSQIRRLV